MSREAGTAGKIARFFIDSKLTPLIIVASLFLGLGALYFLPREEEPQIIVPMIDIFVSMPGAKAKEVEERVTRPMEQLLWEIPGVEYIYSTSSPGISMTVVRFYVGEDEEKSIVRLQSKLLANYDRIPKGVSLPLVKPRYIDDVPILCLTFWSDTADHYMLRRVAAEMENVVKRGDNVSVTTLTGGYRRQVQVRLDPVRLAGFHLDPGTIARILPAANEESKAGSYPSPEGEIALQTTGFLRTALDVGRIVVGTYNERPVYLREVARITDGPEEPDQYVFLGAGPAGGEKGVSASTPKEGVYPAVTLAIAKRKGSNAITVADEVLSQVDAYRGIIIPDNIHVTVTRNYGETAEEKSNELLLHMFIAVFSVTGLIWLALGRREAGVVAIGIPVTLSLTLAVFYLYGYTLNRITLFALIFCIGILVDDAIVVVENVVRHFRLPENKARSFREVAVEAVDEVGNPTILATLTVIAAILPMAFVGGLMGPYMRPIPVGATFAMIFSLLVAFIVTPWAAIRLLKKKKEAGVSEHGETEDWSVRLYRRFMGPLIHRSRLRWGFLLAVVLMLIASFSLVIIGWVRVKMLPFDNKSEFEVIIDMPESATLEKTTNLALDLGNYLKTVNEVTDFEIYGGTAAPMNFNGLVRHYYQRQGPNVAEIEVNLVGKGLRKAQSHEIAKRVRPPLQKIADRYGARIKIAEVPPGPPVLSTLVAEIYGADYGQQRKIAREVLEVFAETPGVVDTDWFMERDQSWYELVVDKEKAALNGISVAQIDRTLQMALTGHSVGLLHDPEEREVVSILMRAPLPERSGIQRLAAIKVPAADGRLVALSDLVTSNSIPMDRSVYHKNLMPVVYVVGDVAGEKESPVYAILDMRKKIDAIPLPQGYRMEQYYTHGPRNNLKYALKWDGEWHITYEVFRDLGIAFAMVLVLIFILVVGWFQSLATPLVIMAAIPFSLIGILPGHGVLGAFFTATSMIGFIAGAGIVVRNSIILVDFIELRLQQGMPLDRAVVDAGAVRFRPMMLTAAAVIVAASVILYDPIFQGLAISLMAGEVASLLLSRATVPILYYLDKRYEFAHGHQIGDGKHGGPGPAPEKPE
jgi:multidrug efflux pump subunit AcrB